MRSLTRNQKFVDDLQYVLDENFADRSFDVTKMANCMRISDRQLQRRVRALTGRSPMQYLRDFRLERSLRYLRADMPVGDVAKSVGFSSHAYFSSCFRNRFGMTPQQARANPRRPPARLESAH